MLAHVSSVGCTTKSFAALMCFALLQVFLAPSAMADEGRASSSRKIIQSGAKTMHTTPQGILPGYPDEVANRQSLGYEPFHCARVISE